MSAPESPGRVAFVTGASRGIGRAIAVALGAAGCRVAFCYSSDAEGAKETQGAVEATGAEVFAVQADVADPESIDQAFRAVEEEFGPIELLVNNAGITRDGLLMRMSDEHWGDVLQTNLTGAFHTIRRATPKMMKGRFGRIVNVSSVTAAMGSATEAGYGAAKAGLLGLSRSLARSVARRGITVNVVVPGVFETEMTNSMAPEAQQQIKAMIPLGRRGDPDELAHAVMFLLDDRAGYVTGSVVTVDGGLSMGA